MARGEGHIGVQVPGTKFRVMVVRQIEELKR